MQNLSKSPQEDPKCTWKCLIIPVVVIFITITAIGHDIEKSKSPERQARIWAAAKAREVEGWQDVVAAEAVNDAIMMRKAREFAK